MTIETSTWTCTGCGTEFVGPDDTLPPGWKMRGARLLCDDCQTPPSRTAPRPARSGGSMGQVYRYGQAIALVVGANRASCALIQRKMRAATTRPLDISNRWSARGWSPSLAAPACVYCCATTSLRFFLWMPSDWRGGPSNRDSA